jgi:SWI/SNF-related matrix-associated actin-dependent regulator of chromatin subfamily A3
MLITSLPVAHKIRNRSSKIFRDVCTVRARYRWCLTGTPIQNSLDDFGALLAFTNVSPFHPKGSLDCVIARPVKERKKGSLEMLRSVVAATCLRRTKADHASTLSLPRKTERVEWVEMGRNDRQLYEFFKRFSYLTAGRDKASRRNAATNILVLISMLRLICDHGEALLPESAFKAWRDRNEKSLTWEMLESGIRFCISCNRDVKEIDSAESAIEGFECGHVICDSCMTKSQSSASQQWCPECGIAAARTRSVRRDSSPQPLSQTGLMAPFKPRYPPSAKVEALLRNIMKRHKKPGSQSQPTKEYEL